MKKLLLVLTFMILSSNVYADYSFEEIKTEKEFIRYPVFMVKSSPVVQYRANAEVKDVVKNTRAALNKYPEMYRSVSLSSEIILDNKDYLSFILHPGSYMGGAHPNYSSLAYIYSKHTGKRLSARDFSSNLNKELLFQGIMSGTKIVYAADRKTILTPEQMFLKDIKTNNIDWHNIVIDSNGVPMLVFPIYALASYACGTTYVSFL